jgi:phenylalanyl-tRNA synthetase beta chain
MKILHHWLEEILLCTLNPEKTSHILTSIGLEVENISAISSVKGGLDGLVAGKVLECEPHPNADRLKITKVLVGNGEQLSIVCGASNVAAGQTVVVALPGSTLYPLSGEPFKIKKTKIRGLESNGMICAEDEIGLGNSHEGIIVLDKDYEPGTPLNQIYPVFHDTLYEIGLTPNRADAASHLGVARDLKTWFNVHEKKNLSINIPYPAELPESSGIQTLDIEILHQQKCRRYAGVVISGIQKSSLPPLMKFRLEACNINSIHPVVDITNYVMLEMGQPMHAFDYEKITGKKIFVGTPENKMPFTLLDGQIIELTEDDLVIGNEEEPMCLAGIYGGKNSGIQPETKTVFLESAYFNPSTIRKSASKFKLKTESSFRFERGTNPDMVIPALHRAASLILETCGGSVSSGPYDLYPEKIEPAKVAFSFTLSNELLGHEIEPETIHSILEELEVKIDAESKDGALCYVPPFKYDVTRQADLVEEIARIYGYDNIPPSVSFKIPAVLTPPSEKQRFRNFILNFFSQKGFSEVQGLSLEKAQWHEKNTSDAVPVLNPVSSESAYLRRHLVFTGMNILMHNIHRQQKDLRLFEIGKIYEKNEKGYSEKDVLGIYTSGRLFGVNHYKADYQTGISDHLGLIYSMADMLNATVNVEEITTPLITGVYIYLNDILCGFCGYPGANVRKMFDADSKLNICISQLDFSAFLKSTKSNTVFKTIPEFPQVRRDLAFIVSKSVSYASILQTIKKEYKGKYLQDIRLFDIYEGDQIGENKKSLALSFTFRSDKKTLTEEELRHETDGIMQILKNILRAEIRE